MCLYVAHVRVCAHCSHEDTVLISERLCKDAALNGIFASCGTGPGTRRNPTRYQCWGCQEAIDMRMSGTAQALAPWQISLK